MSSTTTSYKYGKRESQIENYQDLINSIEDRILMRGGNYTDEDIEKIQLETGANKDMIEGFAYCQAGDLFLHGDGYQLPKDIEKATEYYLKASGKGSTYALWRLAHIYKTSGQLDKCRDIFHQMAEMDSHNKGVLYPYEENIGVIEASYLLGINYEYGREEEGIIQDIPKSIRYLEKAALGGHPEANHHLGLIYMKGNPSIPRDTVKGMFYLKKGGELGSDSSMYDYACVIKDTNPSESKLWMEKSQQYKLRSDTTNNTFKPSQ
ncbi:hypothetical protein DLAC_05797 [Tieghemostelium lacteum]|uniref:HCP-like protein n=1 Tax=Tieghemostelium lacteum TaxID=361077 RepID=A0A151ZH23_TIELA|nr:hypothetical protein DLAC_05797 [Tieghemostelium lacteum]|eukprot:KYQ93164.1 hypothetical protein DLAC_05797 [Tieghemostelium lacteum]